MYRLLTLASLLLLSFTATLSAQERTPAIKGSVYDTAVNRGMAYATVSIVNAKDSTLISFVRADSSGNFRIPSLSKGKYLLSASYVGYVPLWREIEMPEGGHLDMGRLIMTDLTHAGDVTVTARRPPVTINNDTVEFNAENFKTAPNAVVEDMLKKMPGMTVDPDGTVRVNGQRINRVLVNGKEFFTGDPKLATRNLDADAIDKVQLFDKKSDRAQFTGVDDGQSEKTLNLKLKKDRNNALFGRVTAGAGTKERYDGQTNINKFNGDQQLSFLGMANNTNRQGFTLSDVLNFSGDLSRGLRSGGGGITIRTIGGDDNGLPVTGVGQNQQGVARTIAGGVNYNNNWNQKTDLNTSGMMSDIHLNTDRSTNRQNLAGNGGFNYQSNSNTARNSKQQRWNAAIDQKIDSFAAIKFTPLITAQQNDSRSHNSFVSTDNSNAKLNEGFTDNRTHSEALNMGGTVLYRQRTNKKGRTVSATLTANYNDSKQNGDLNTKNTYYNAGVFLKDSIINQKNTRNAVTRNFGLNVAYTEPIGKRSLLEATAFYNANSGESDRRTYDYNNGSGKYDQENLLLTNDFRNRYNYGGGSLNIRSNQPKFTFSGGATMQSSILESINNTNNNTIRQSFTDVLPNASFQYRFASSRSLSLNMSTSITQPSTSQLQPIKDISDPLNIYTGNPQLKRSYAQSVSLNYFSTNTYTQRNFFAFINLLKTNNAIVNSDQITNGIRTSMPVNADGTLFLFGNMSTGFAVKKLRSRFEVGVGSNYTKTISFLNGQQNNIENMSISPSFTWSFSKENVLDLQASARLNISKAKYSLQPQFGTNYLQQTYNMDATAYLPFGFILNNTFNYTVNSGRADGFNIQVPFWNASLAKGFLKGKRAEVKLSVFDLLNKNQGINRSANQNYIEDTRYNVLQRYFLLGFTYRLNKAASSARPGVVIRTFNAG